MHPREQGLGSSPRSHGAREGPPCTSGAGTGSPQASPRAPMQPRDGAGRGGAVLPPGGSPGPGPSPARCCAGCCAGCGARPPTCPAPGGRRGPAPARPRTDPAEPPPRLARTPARPAPLTGAGPASGSPPARPGRGGRAPPALRGPGCIDPVPLARPGATGGAGAGAGFSPGPLPLHRGAGGSMPSPCPEPPAPLSSSTCPSPAGSGPALGPPPRAMPLGTELPARGWSRARASSGRAGRWAPLATPVPRCNTSAAAALLPRPGLWHKPLAAPFSARPHRSAPELRARAGPGQGASPQSQLPARPWSVCRCAATLSARCTGTPGPLCRCWQPRAGRPTQLRSGLCLVCHSKLISLGSWLLLHLLSCRILLQLPTIPQVLPTWNNRGLQPQARLCPRAGSPKDTGSRGYTVQPYTRSHCSDQGALSQSSAFPPSLLQGWGSNFPLQCRRGAACWVPVLPWHQCSAPHQQRAAPSRPLGPVQPGPAPASSTGPAAGSPRPLSTSTSENHGVPEPRGDRDLRGHIQPKSCQRQDQLCPNPPDKPHV